MVERNIVTKHKGAPMRDDEPLHRLEELEQSRCKDNAILWDRN
jgi:hypothetical protein